MISENVKFATGALAAHKLRSALTILGIVIGVTTVIAMVSIIEGFNNNVIKSFQSFGATLVQFQKFDPQFGPGGRDDSQRNRKNLTYEDAIALKKQCPSMLAVSPERYWFSGGANDAPDVIFGSQQATPDTIAGVTPDYPLANNHFIGEGRFITADDVLHSTPIIVIGSNIADTLFSRRDPIGKEVTLRGRKYAVVGVMEKQGSVLGQSQDNQLWVPINAFRRQFGIHSTLDLFIRAKGGVSGLPRSVDDVRAILRSRRRTPFRGDDPFATVSADAVQAIWRQISAGGFALMIFISGISLVVGGIVIMNIMLVSVIERTREIGVRRALGATKRNIRTQFLTEAMLLAFGGGAVGVALGYGISKGIAAAFPLPTLVRPSLVISGLLIAVVTGALAGFFPARRAAAMPPVDALRYE